MKTGRPRLDPFEVHGYRMYGRGCRCAVCTEANRMYSQRFRDKVKAQRLAEIHASLKSPLQTLKERWQND